jgi:hypothetical protein
MLPENVETVMKKGKWVTNMIVYTLFSTTMGSCGHRHRSILTAARCQAKTTRLFRKRGDGSYSDRTLQIIDDKGLSGTRKPSEEEYLVFIELCNTLN